MTLWQQRGLLVWNAPADHNVLLHNAKHAYACGFRVAAVKLHDGTHLYSGEHPGTNELAVEVYRRQGFTVGAWGYNRGAEPEAEASLIRYLYEKHRLAFYIADAEVEFEHSSASAYARSSHFTRAFRAALPELPAALTSFGRCSLHSVDWAAWQLAGFRFLPQAYTNENSALRPALCVADAMQHGISLRRFRHAGAVTWADRRFVHPMLGCYGGARGRVPGREYALELRTAGTRGFTIYAADFALDDDYAQLARAR